MQVWKSMRYVLVLFAAICLAGCSRSDSMTSEPIRPKTKADELMEHQIAVVNNLAEAMESRASDDVIASMNAELDEAGKLWDSSGLDEQELDDAIERHKEEYDKAMRRLTTASMKSGAEAL